MGNRGVLRNALGFSCDVEQQCLFRPEPACLPHSIRQPGLSGNRARGTDSGPEPWLGPHSPGFPVPRICSRAHTTVSPALWRLISCFRDTLESGRPLSLQTGPWQETAASDRGSQSSQAPPPECPKGLYRPRTY